MTLQTETSRQTVCFHCGDLCDNSTIFHDDKPFCCQGCRLVYELLLDNRLGGYYALETHPGVKTDDPKNAHYAYLDDPATRNKILDFSDGTVGKVTFRIPQMHCSACIWLLENLSKLDAGISQPRVHFLRKELTVTFREKQISLRKLVELLASIGYAPELQLDRLEQKSKKRSPQKSLYLKLGIAGFAFGNIMLFSFPEYLDIRDDLGLTLQSFFGYLNIVLALPVLLYSSRDYFVSALAGLRQKMLNIDFPISLGIIAIFLRSLYEIFTGTGTGYLDSFAGLIFFLLIGKVFQQKSYDALSFERDYKSYFPIAVTKKESGSERIISLSALQIGDTILVRNQELIPADAVLLSGPALIDYSFVTGESAPVEKRSGDLLFAGGRQIGAAIEVQVIKEVSQSYLTSLWNNDVFHKTAASPLRSVANVVAKYFTIAVLSIASVTALFWLFVEPGVAVNALTAVLIIACPCALALSMPFTFGNTLRIFGKKAFFLKNTDVVEKLAKIDTIVFDKTGTLTSQGKTDVVFHPAPVAEATLSTHEKALVASLVQHSTHALSRHILRWLACESGFESRHFQEWRGKGIAATVAGHTLRLGAAQWIFSGKNGQQPALPTSAASLAFLEIDGHYRGHFVIANHYRPQMPEVLANLKQQFEVYLLSGDNASEQPRLAAFFGQNNGSTRMHFNQSPDDKLTFIKNLQAQGKQVMMIGDGLNDAGALKQSDVGVAISEDITAFSPACDAILAARSFDKLAGILRFSQSSYRVVLASFGISFLYNIVGISFAVTGLLSPLLAAILMPVSSISVVAFATLATRWLAHKV